MCRTFTALLIIAALAGCAAKHPAIPEPTRIASAELPRPRLNLPEPAEYNAREWSPIVITRDNAKSMFDEHGEAFLAFTPDHYENMSKDIQDIQRIALQWKSNAIAYREYYEGVAHADNLIEFLD